MNGSRGVIVDWIPAAEIPDEVALGGTSKGKTPGGSGRVGTEEWRQKAAEAFMDQQQNEMYPLVFFASGKESEPSILPNILTWDTRMLAHR